MSGPAKVSRTLDGIAKELYGRQYQYLAAEERECVNRTLRQRLIFDAQQKTGLP